MTEREGSSDEEAAVRDVIEAWTAAVRRKDYDAILQNHTSDFVMFDVPPPFQSKGLEAYGKTWDMFFFCNSGPVKFDIHEMTVTAGEDVAFAVARMGCTTPGADGTLLDLDFRLTVGLRKIDGQWMILHEHHSVPATD